MSDEIPVAVTWHKTFLYRSDVRRSFPGPLGMIVSIQLANNQPEPCDVDPFSRTWQPQRMLWMHRLKKKTCCGVGGGQCLEEHIGILRSTETVLGLGRGFTVFYPLKGWCPKLNRISSGHINPIQPLCCKNNCLTKKKYEKVVQRSNEN